MGNLAQIGGQGDLVATLASYVPDAIVRRLARDPRPLIAPLVERFTGAVLIADVSGFTTIAESLAKQGARGAEALNGMLNDYFGRAIEVRAFNILFFVLAGGGNWRRACRTCTASAAAAAVWGRERSSDKHAHSPGG